VGACDNCTWQPRKVVVATFEVNGGSYRACLEEAERIAAMTGLENLEVDISPLRVAELVQGNGGVLTVTWEADAIARMEVPSEPT
jgi:hypothetical protein